MLNIYGEKVTLTKAQRREYVALLEGPITAHRKERQHAVLNRLKDKGLVKVVYAWGNVTRFERWT